nr:FAD-dependent oxidoreductase [Acidipila sp. EB88]
MRHVADVEHIATLLGGQPEGKTAVLIGDSFIAFEAASALTTRGLKVTVVAQSEQPFAKKFGPDAANAILALHKSKGVTLKASSDAQSISAESVTLKSGETLPADLVLVAIGVQPATGFAHGLPLEQDGGIPVAPSLQAAPHVWVAGDVASVEGVRIEHWRLAQQHGRSAAGAMLLALGASPLELPAPEREPFHGVPFFWTAHFGKRFGYVGHASDWDELQIDGELGTAPDGSATTDPAFLAYYVKDQQVAAILGCGKDSAIAALAESMRSPLTLTEARTAAANA